MIRALKYPRAGVGGLGIKNSIEALGPHLTFQAPSASPE
jgi:hypothetical protein